MCLPKQAGPYLVMSRSVNVEGTKDNITTDMWKRMEKSWKI